MNRHTQKDRVLAMLRTHGKYGIRSDRFLEVGIPRAAARIWELRGEGHEISGEREKQFIRYYLANSAGVGAGSSQVRQTLASTVSEAVRPSASVDSGGDSPRGSDGLSKPGGSNPPSPSVPGEPARPPTDALHLFDLAEALERYGEHETGCVKGDACTCGLRAALALFQDSGET